MKTPFKHIEAFFESLVVEKNISRNTLVSYKLDLEDFFGYLARNHLSIENHMETQIIQNYLSDLTDRELSNSTRARRLSCLKQYFRFLLDEEEITADPTAGIEGPKRSKRLPKILSEQDIVKLIETAYEDASPEGIRLQTLLELLYATGMRITEILSLPFTSAKQAFQTKSLYIIGKGNKERWLPLSDTSLKVLKDYLEIRDLFGDKSIYLFPSTGKQDYLTRQRFQQLIKDLSVRSGLDPQKVSAHVIRHAFASHLLRHGADLVSLQKLLGHADISTTEIYTHVQPDRLMEVVENFHPLSSSQRINNEIRKKETS